MNIYLIISIITITAAAATVDEVDEEPSWYIDCTFELRPNKELAVVEPVAYRSSTRTTEVECREMCGADSRCGMYRWSKIGNKWCHRYPISLKLWAEKTGMNPEKMMRDSPSNNMGSRQCDVALASFLSPSSTTTLMMMVFTLSVFK